MRISDWSSDVCSSDLLKVACAESRETLGGTCLNVGCIPSKAMLHASEYFEAAAGGAMAKLGIKVTPELDLDAMHGQRKDAVKQPTGGIDCLVKETKHTWTKGQDRFAAPTTLSVGKQPEQGQKKIRRAA